MSIERRVIEIVQHRRLVLIKAAVIVVGTEPAKIALKTQSPITERSLLSCHHTSRSLFVAVQQGSINLSLQGQRRSSIHIRGYHGIGETQTGTVFVTIKHIYMIGIIALTNMEAITCLKSAYIKIGTREEKGIQSIAWRIDLIAKERKMSIIGISLQQEFTGRFPSGS